MRMILRKTPLKVYSNLNMLAADFRMCFLCCSFFLIYNIIIVIILCLSVLCNSVKHILEFNYYFQEEEGQFFHYYQNCYSNRCVQNADCRSIDISALVMMGNHTKLF